jgi:type III secretion protein V
MRLEVAGARRRALAADAALALFVMLAVGMLIVPLPTPLLDVLLASNLALACVLLFTALYVPHALALSTLPTLLLVTTLYRLALNVSSTRLILLQADAGRVIRAFGDFVVRGNYVVGGVVFLILTLIQYLVIARGSERVAEVGARFSLDAMPGKQLAIDADLRAGALDVETARARRAAIEHESQFYGAMDGAMKFVKGDAIAGIVIAVISLVGGTGIGVGMHGLTFLQSLQRYGLLTIGDGLVAQIPSLVISTAAGLVVTRVAARDHARSLGEDVAHQLASQPRVLAAAAAFLALLGVVPGLPALPFLLIALLLGAGAYAAANAARMAPDAHGSSASQAHDDAGFEIALGTKLAQAVRDGKLDGALRDVTQQHAATLHDTLGAELPAATLRTHAELPANGYALRLHGLTLLRGEAPANLALFPALLDTELPGLLRERARELLGLDDVRRKLDALAQHKPTLVRSLVPNPVSVATLTEVLRRLLDEGVSIRPLARILEALAAEPDRDAARDPARLTERARAALREPIVEASLHDGVLRVHRVDPLIEDAVRDAVRACSPGQALPLPAELARDIVRAGARARAEHAGAQVLVTQPELRRALWQLLAPELRGIRVLSYAELPTGVRVEERAPIAP